jgi:hypothetical protein
MIQKVAEHLVDIDFLPAKATIADIGCRGFIFTNEMRRLGHTVIPVDVDDLEGNYHRAAISDFDGLCGVIKSNDPQGTKIDKLGNGIDCFTLESFSKMFEVAFWDLIKLDVEGSEFEIIMSLQRPLAKQLSIEFHLHTGAYKQHEVDQMTDKLKALGYSIASHEYTNEHGSGYNYWSSLFILK